MPSPPAPSDPNPAGAVLHGMWSGIREAATHHPWLPVLVVLLVGTALVRSARIAIHTRPRDAVRLFPRADKTVLLRWAGNRCEHHTRIGARRCPSTERLEADHVHPWSRGGWTHVTNGQILCRAHNREKSAAIPWDRSLRRLDERRAAYYPSDVSRAIVRHGTR